MQRIVGVVEAVVKCLRQLTHVSGRHFAWQREDGGADMAEGRAVHWATEINLAGTTDAEDGVEPTEVRVDGQLVALQADDLATVGHGGTLEVVLRPQRLFFRRDEALSRLERS